MDSTFTRLTNLFTGPALANNLINFGGRLLGAIVVFIAGMLLIKAITGLVRGTLKRAIHDITYRQYASSATSILLWVVLILILLSVFGIETTALAALLGAAGLAIGLALQGSLSNFAAGFMLLMLRPFKAGDEIEVVTVVGTVIEIGVFSTTIDMPDHVRAFVPNNTIFTNVVKNKSVNEYLRVDMKITIAGDSDVNRAQQIVHRLLSTNELILDVPRPDVQLIENDTPGITMGIRPYTKLKNLEAVRTTVTRDVSDELRKGGIEVIKQ